MLFFLELSRSIGKEGKTKLVFFTLWFAVIFTAITFVFTYLLTKSDSLNTTSNWGSFLFLSIIILCLTCFSLTSWLIIITFLFGKRTSTQGKEQIILTTLYGIELVREELTTLQTINAEIFPEIEKDIAWSWIALDNRQGVNPTGAIGLVEAAIWNLVAHKIVNVKIRHEKISYLFNKFKVYEGDSVYFTLIAENNDAFPGVWERRLYETIKKSPETDRTMKAFDWVIMAFGNSSANPMAKALAYTEDEFIEKNWAKRSGKLVKKFEWTADSKRLSLWPVIRSYIKSHNIESLLAKEIEAALKHCEDVG